MHSRPQGISGIPRSEPQEIDLHCHILPRLDDGSRGLDDSVAMALQAESDGIEAICATPHIRHDHDVRIEEVADRVEAVNARLREELAPRIEWMAETAPRAIVVGEPLEPPFAPSMPRVAAEG